MRREEFYRLMKKMDATQRSIKLAESIIKEKSENPRYPDLFSLESFVKEKAVICRFKYNCTACPTKKRNQCWKEAKKIDNKRVLLAGLPYPRVILGEMKLSDLWIIAAHINASTVRKSKSAMVDAIIKAQYEYDYPEKKSNKKEKKDASGKRTDRKKSSKEKSVSK